MAEAATAPTADPGAAPHVFRVELDTDPDALARLLIPFAAIQVVVASVSYSRRAAGAVARIATAGLRPDHARHLQRRLEQAPCVRRVTLR